MQNYTKIMDDKTKNVQLFHAQEKLHTKTKVLRNKINQIKTNIN